MSILSSILLICFGVWLLRRGIKMMRKSALPAVSHMVLPSSSAGELKEKFVEAEAGYKKFLREAEQTLTKIKNEAEREVELRKQYAELEAGIVQQAMERENRAKAVVRVALKRQGFSDEQIEEVIEKSVDAQGE